MTDNQSTGAVASGSHGSMAQDWPGWVVAALVIACAIYSFSPRPEPEFVASGLKSDRVLLNDAARAGTRLVAVGERGTILVADDPRGPWRQPNIDQDRGSALTRVMFLNNSVAIAVGHDSWILRTQDQGNNWKEVAFNPERSEPLLGLAGPYDGKLYAFGAFGQFLVSRDSGVSWQREELVEEGGGAKPAQQQVIDDPLAMFETAGDIGSGLNGSHLNAMVRAGDGALILVGERGLIARSTNGGASWRVQPGIYSGSFYGILVLTGGRLIIHGMRGHVFYSDDHGRSWKPSQVPVANSLFGGTSMPGGDIVLTGASNTLLLSRDNGVSFTRVSEKGPHGWADLMAFDNRELLKVGEGGLSLVSLENGR